ncbi:MAG: M67 family metallopeptidase [Betaproteobacteria bacterium]
MSSARLELCERHLAELLTHCRREAPNEACGLLSGREGRVTRVWPARNALASPTEYLIEPEDQFAAMRAIWAADEELLAIYHSHPATPAYPSPRDIAQAYYREAAYVIVSLAPREEVRAFAIGPQGVTPVELRIVRGEAQREEVT